MAVGEIRLKKLVAGSLGLLTSLPITALISESATQVSVADTSLFPDPPFYGFIDAEIIRADQRHGASPAVSFDISRGEKGSFPDQHAKGAVFSTADAFFMEALDEWWDIHIDKDLIYYPLRYLYTKQEALIWLLGGNWKRVNWQQARTQQSDSDKFGHLKQLQQANGEQIKAIEALSKTMVTTTLVAPIAAVRAIVPDLFLLSAGIDPNDPFYRGDPTHRGPGGNQSGVETL